MARAQEPVLQFKITLRHIEPPIWRRIHVPLDYSCWDLHVAIQDAMGWFDCHPHLFRFTVKGKRKPLVIGLSFDDEDEEQVVPGWEVPVGNAFCQLGAAAIYEYDFGDGWQHEVVLEGLMGREKGIKYPRCLAGERACPPEDCGGVPGYQHLLEIIRDPQHEEYKHTVAWVKTKIRQNYIYRPEEFHPDLVRFDNPKRRLKNLFGPLAR